MEADPQIHVLADRVRWLDRYRHVLAMGISAAFAVCGVITFPTLFKWIALPGAMVLAFLIDVGFAGVLAVWETNHARLLADRGLPRAQLRRK